MPIQTHAHTQTCQLTKLQPRIPQNGCDWWSPVAAPWSIPWPSGPAGRARSAADANGWSRPVDGTSTSTIGKAGRFLHKSLGVGKVGKVGKVGNGVCHSFLEVRSFGRLQCSMSGGNKSILSVWVRIRYPKTGQFTTKQTEFSCFVSPLE